MMNNRIYNLVLNEQSTLKELLEKMGVENIDDKLKDILDEELYEIVEADKDSILAIKKKSTGEIFHKGGSFYHSKYDIWINSLWFDASLSGTKYFTKYYKNYIRGGDGGLYHLNEMSLGL